MKRRLTQSEKQKHFVEGGGQPLNNFSLKKSSSLQFLECPQNLVHSRHFIEKCEEIDKARSKSIAHINGVKHLLKLKYKGLIKDEEDDDITRTFFLQPGFRFRSNGDVKKLRDPRVVPEVDINAKRSNISLARSTPSNQSLKSKKSTNSLKEALSDSSSLSQRLGHGDGKVRKDPYKDIDVNAAIKEIELDLAKMKTDKDLIDINRRIQDVRHSLTFVRAHANDYKPDIHHISVNPDDQESFLRQLRDHDVDRKGTINQRMSRHCTRLNCVGCEFRLKCGNDILPFLRRKVSSEHLKRWQYAPRGSYVGILDEESTTSLSNHNRKRSTKSAKVNTCNKDKSSKERNEKPIGRRQSKSAVASDDRKPTRTTSQEKPRQHKPHGLVDRFKEREKQSTSHHYPSETSSHHLGHVSSDHCRHMDSERILQVQDFDHGDVHDDNDDAAHAGDEPVAGSSLVEIIAKEVSKQKEKTSAKVEEFFEHIPEVKPSISTWRNSSGHIITWKPHDKCHNSKSPCCSDMTWAEYHKNRNHPTQEHSLHYKFYLSSQEKLTGDPNSIEELKKCRYLRDFKLRKNMPMN